MAKRNHVARLAQRVFPKKYRKKVMAYGKKASANGKKALTNGVDRVLFGKKGGKR